jgi:hypothetical protein
MATKVQGPSVARTFTDSIFWEVSLATNKKIATDLIITRKHTKDGNFSRGYICMCALLRFHSLPSPCLSENSHTFSNSDSSAESCFLSPFCAGLSTAGSRRLQKDGKPGGTLIGAPCVGHKEPSLFRSDVFALVTSSHSRKLGACTFHCVSTYMCMLHCISTSMCMKTSKFQAANLTRFTEFSTGPNGTLGIVRSYQTSRSLFVNDVGSTVRSVASGGPLKHACFEK